MRNELLCLVLAVVLAAPAPAPAYIAVRADRLTLCEVILEFPNVLLLKVEKSDRGRGAFVMTVTEVLAGTKPENSIRLALLADGKIPKGLDELQPGSPIVAFMGSPDRRTLFLAEGGWFLTNLDQGWERFNQFRNDFNTLFTGSPQELAATVRVLQRGGAVTVPIQPLKTDADSRLYIRYEADFPHRRWPALPPQSPQPSLTDLRNAAESKSVPERQRALLQLATQPGAEADLRKGLRDAHAEVRLAAAVGLGQQPKLSAEAIAALAQALGDEDRFTAAMAAWGLGRAGPLARAALPDLDKALADRNFDHDYRPHRAAEAAEAILRIGSAEPLAERARKLLLSERMLNDERVDSEGTRTAAARSLGRCGPAAKKALPHLVKRLKDPLPATRIAAAEAIVLIGGDDKSRAAAREVLTAEVSSGVLLTRIQAIRAAATTKDAALLPLLRRASQESDPDLKREAAEALRSLEE